MAGSSVDRVAARRSTTFDELSAVTELEDVTFLEVSGRRLFDQQEPRTDADSRTTLSVWLRGGDDGTTLEVRCRLELGSAQADFAVDAAAAFSVRAPFELTPEVQQEFLDRIGVTVLYPYLREALQGTAAKLGVDTPVLSLRGPGQGAR
ncbi:hypothetical protein OH807_26330 [Kitasatospora sp. NBC_01560]|uniref:hypothetical protein n=1 Tax=Kitasatospora sp. NBC_01560 TaxID=2975965 RepID=UPI003868ABDF